MLDPDDRVKIARTEHGCLVWCGPDPAKSIGSGPMMPRVIAVDMVVRDGVTEVRIGHHAHPRNVFVALTMTIVSALALIAGSSGG